MENQSEKSSYLVIDVYNMHWKTKNLYIKKMSSWEKFPFPVYLYFPKLSIVLKSCKSFNKKVKSY